MGYRETKDDNHYEEEAAYFFEELCAANKDILFVYTTDLDFMASGSFAESNPGGAALFKSWLDKNPILTTSAQNQPVQPHKTCRTRLFQVAQNLTRQQNQILHPQIYRSEG